MYFKNIYIENVGPILSFNLDLTRDDETPNSLIVAGSNGAGKSFLLAHILNSILTAYSIAYDDTEIKKGNAYKLRSGAHISYGKKYSYSRVEFGEDFYVAEIQLDKVKTKWEQENDFVPAHSIWSKLPKHETSHYDSNYPQKINELKQSLREFPFLIFPPNRFEKPVWENKRNLDGVANYNVDDRLVNEAPHKVIQSDPLRQNQDWLLDLIYDANAIEKTEILIIQDQKRYKSALADGPANKALRLVNSFLLELLGVTGSVGYLVGSRGGRQISVRVNGKVVVQNLFSLSTGQSSLLNIFLGIMRCNDLCGRTIEKPEDLVGVVVVDEIDLHLHSSLQYTVLPNLIKRFPNVQFILTTHSPLFLMGLKNNHEINRFKLINLPTGAPIDVEQFSEFESSFNAYQKSNRFKKEIIDQSVRNGLPIICVEGEIDLNYLTKAADLLDFNELLSEVNLIQGNGESNMKRVLRSFKEVEKFSNSNKFLFLFDCDVSIEEKTSNNLCVRKIPSREHKISKGIENLFPTDIINKAKKENPQFIDITKKTTKTERGVEIGIPEKWEINPDEKRNLCNWILKNGTKDDFKHFEVAFAMIEELKANI